MKPNAVTISATYADRYTLDQLSQMIAARAKFLKQTPKKAVTATAINVLTSLKTDMAVAKKSSPIGPQWKVEISRDEGRVGGWARGRRVMRPFGGGHSFKDRPVNKAGNYARGKNGDLYRLVITFHGRPFYDAYVLGSNRADVERYAEIRIRAHMNQYRGVNKRTLGLIQQRIAKSGAGVQALQNQIDNAQALYANELSSAAAVASARGTDSNYAVKCASEIRASAYALKHGPGYVATAMQKAANKTAGFIRRCGNLPMFTRPPETPFPELTSKAS